MASELLAKKQKFGLHLQTDWATTGSASTAYETMWYNAANTTPDFGVSNEEFDFSSANGTMLDIDRSHIDTYGIKQVPFTAKADRSILAHHLVAAFQSVSEGALTPFLKTIVPVNDILDFNGDEGYVFSLAMGNYDDGASAGDGLIFKQGVLNDLSIEFNNEANGIARGADLSGTWFFTSVDTDQYLSGAWTNTGKPPNILGLETTKYQLNLSWDSVAYTDICWHRFMMSINNNFSGTCRGAGGVVTQWRFGTPELTFEIDIPKNSSTYKLIGDYATGVRGNFDFFRGDGSSAGDFNVGTLSSSCEMTASPVQYSNGYEIIRISGRIIGNTLGQFTDLIKFADGTDRGY